MSDTLRIVAARNIYANECKLLNTLCDVVCELDRGWLITCSIIKLKFIYSTKKFEKKHHSH